jgi:hypothetical protein
MEIWSGREDGNLVGPRQDVGHFGHEMHAAEHNILGFGICSLAGQFQRVTGIVSVAKHFIALVVVTEDHQALAQRLLRLDDTRFALIVTEHDVRRLFDCRCLHVRILLPEPAG